VGKWVAGIIAAVLASLIGWWLISPGGPLNPQQPEVTITSFNVDNGIAGQTVNAYFEVENTGDGVAQACAVHWYSHGYDYEPRMSVQFGLSPNESLPVTVTSWTYNTPGQFQSYARLVCANETTEGDWSAAVLIS
jgi:hypothetical protein